MTNRQRQWNRFCLEFPKGTPNSSINRFYVCFRKLAHNDFLSAVRHADSVQIQEPGRVFVVYGCGYCGKLHIGHDRKQSARINKLRHLLNDNKFTAHAPKVIVAKHRRELAALTGEHGIS